MVTDKNPSTTHDSAREEMAKLLDGHELRDFDDAVVGPAALAKNGGLVIVFGASDDLMELRGAIDDEVGAYDGGSAFIHDDELLRNECGEDDDCPYFRALQAKAFEIQALWCEDAAGAQASVDDALADSLVWMYRLSVEHASFTILEDGEPWCRGVVFALADLPGTGEEV